jgi:DTW domain-containing protein YfiP
VKGGYKIEYCGKCGRKSQYCICENEKQVKLSVVSRVMNFDTSCDYGEGEMCIISKVKGSDDEDEWY